MRPLENSCTDLCSSTDWNEASWVMFPSLSVRRYGWVIPVLDCLLFITFAVSRNCLICSLLRLASAGWSGKAWQTDDDSQTNTPNPRAAQRRPVTRILDTPCFLAVSLNPNHSVMSTWFEAFGTDSKPPVWVTR